MLALYLSSLPFSGYTLGLLFSHASESHAFWTFDSCETCKASRPARLPLSALEVVVPILIIAVIMADIRGYKISVPSAAIEELHQKLALSKFPIDTDSDGDDWGRGAPVAAVKRIAKYWQEEFSWAAFEERLNKLPHFETTMSLEGYDPFELHFIHQKSENPHAIPLLFVHGCSYYTPCSQLQE